MNFPVSKWHWLLGAMLASAFVFPAPAQVTVFQADFQNSVVQAETAVTNLNAGTEAGAWALQIATNVNLYGDATGTQKALCPDTNSNLGYGLTANFSSPVLLASNVTVKLCVARGRMGAPGTGKTISVIGYDLLGNPSFDLQIFANQNQAAGTNGALYWNDGGSYTNWFGTNYSRSGDVRNLPVSETGYNPASMTLLQMQLSASGYVVSVDISNAGVFNWVSSLLPYNGAPSHLASISITGGPGAGDWFDTLLVSGVPGQTGVKVVTNADVAVQPETQAQLINGWGFDIKGVSGNVLTPAFAQMLFVTNQMKILRLPIFGDAADLAHPSSGVVVGSYYAGTLYAMTNARAASSNVILFASKKSDGTNSFPSWVENDDGVIASQYALMLADYLQFMWTNGFAMDVLGIDNESSYNEGNITPSVYENVITSLRALSVSRGFPLPKNFIAPENYSPDTNWLGNLIASGWGSNVNIVGTHYYAQFRPLHSLQTLVALGGNSADWQSEVHWDNTFGDVIDNGEAALAALFDCTDSGLSSYVWWAFTNSGVKGEIEQNFSQSTTQAYPVITTDIHGTNTNLGTLMSRAYRNGTNLTLWVVNNTTNLYNPCNVTINEGSLAGVASFTQWNVNSQVVGSVGFSSPTNFALSIGSRTITQITVGYSSPASPPVLAPISNQTLTAGQVLTITNQVSDANVPPRILTWSVQPSIAGLTINSNTGVLNWRPTIAQSPGSNALLVIVSDNGTPSLSAAQPFSVTVLRPAQPQLSASPAAAGSFNLGLSGEVGPDYQVFISSNLVNWSPLLTTNPAALPLTLSLPVSSNAPQQFYRVELGP